MYTPVAYLLYVLPHPPTRTVQGGHPTSTDVYTAIPYPWCAVRICWAVPQIHQHIDRWYWYSLTVAPVLSIHAYPYSGKRFINRRTPTPTPSCAPTRLRIRLRRHVVWTTRHLHQGIRATDPCTLHLARAPFTACAFHHVTPCPDVCEPGYCTIGG